MSLQNPKAVHDANTRQYTVAGREFQVPCGVIRE